MELYEQFSKPKEKSMSSIIVPSMDIKTLPITPNAYEKMHLYREMYDSLVGGSGLEFFGFMLRRADSQSYNCEQINNHVIRDIVLGKNQENTYAHTFLDATDVQDTLAGLDKKVWQLAGWTHRHPDGIFSSSSEDKGHNITMITSIQSGNYLDGSMTVPMDHLECEFKSLDNEKGTEISFYDKRDGSIYTMQTPLSIKDAKSNIIQFKDKKVPVKLSYAHSMIIRRKRDPAEVFSEVITRKYSGNSLNYIQKNGMSEGQRTTIDIIQVSDDIVLDEKKMMQEVIDCTYIPKIHKAGIHVTKGYAFGEKISSLAEKTGGGYFFINKTQPMSRAEFKEMFAPYLQRRLEPTDYADWEKRAMHEMPILPNLLNKDMNVADKVLDNNTPKTDKTVATSTNPATSADKSTDIKSLDDKLTAADNMDKTQTPTTANVPNDKTTVENAQLTLTGWQKFWKYISGK